MQRPVLSVQGTPFQSYAWPDKDGSIDRTRPLTSESGWSVQETVKNPELMELDLWGENETRKYRQQWGQDLACSCVVNVQFSTVIAVTNTYGSFWVNTCTRNHRSNRQCRNVTKEMVEVEGSPIIPSRARRVGHAGWFQRTLWFAVLPALYGLMSVHCCLNRNPENSLTFTRFYSSCCCWYKANICAHKESRCKSQIGAHRKCEVWD